MGLERLRLHGEDSLKVMIRESSIKSAISSIHATQGTFKPDIHALENILYLLFEEGYQEGRKETNAEETVTIT